MYPVAEKVHYGHGLGSLYYSRPLQIKRKIDRDLKMSSEQSCVVVQLKDGKYWVGETSDKEGYIKKLFSKKSAPAYVKKHAPVQVVEVSQKSCAEVVAGLMRVHGKRNVRGSSFVDPLSTGKKALINKELRRDFAASNCQGTLYALLLKNGTYFVGRTDDLPETLASYQEGMVKGVYLTKRAKSLFDEDRLVEEMMFNFGIDKVRGGSYRGTTLEPYQRETLTKKFDYAQAQK